MKKGNEKSFQGSKWKISPFCKPTATKETTAKETTTTAITRTRGRQSTKSTKRRLTLQIPSDYSRSRGIRSCIELKVETQPRLNSNASFCSLEGFVNRTEGSNEQFVWKETKRIRKKLTTTKRRIKALQKLEKKLNTILKVLNEKSLKCILN